MDPFMVAVLFAIVGTIVPALIFQAFRTQYRLADVAAAAVLSGAATMLPTYGGSVSMFTVLLLASVNPPPFF